MNHIKEIRTNKKITQIKLAEAANIDLRYLQRIENNLQIPNVYIGLALAIALNTTVEVLFCFQGLQTL